MIRACLVLTVLLALGTQARTPELREQLRPFQFLVGSCWTGTFPDGQRTDTHCFEPVFDGQFLRDRHVVQGAETPYAGETIYAWDPELAKVVYTYWASDGAISTGVAEPGSAGEIVFPEAHVSDGGELTLKSVWTRRGDDTYDVRVAEKQEDGTWREVWRMTMHRAPADDAKQDSAQEER